MKAPAIQQGFADASDNLKKKGVSLDSSGVSIKTNRRAPTREEYLDATQRSFAKSSEMIAQHKDAFTTTASQRSKDQKAKTETAYRKTA
ncbi:hypothetical protein BCV69DRAFT_143195 [Microstroma glucosiphilum]|uniref:Uncharacterized protein n=1 Tax=Pseudomicrostroma glucosiphilum TaxID=1684307 RepID=A0A316UGW2_9BASI|nr:hypothetical protein BCV69DRAFT_143195 [Pseudomicrostroma glucosiphilum]PWN22415.1 hypothetical protein BCV69DRAFT_143195 [Pseudomicrostroma glucosiphilum]